MYDYQAEHDRDLYERHRQRMRERTRETSQMGRDIAPIPEVAHPKNKEKGKESFRYFCEHYFPQLFTIPWSEDHIKVINKIEKAVKDGGLFAIAMPRGSGKALSLFTPIPTPTGYTTMGEIKVGDTVYDQDGNKCKVTFVTETQHDHVCYRLKFSTGETFTADENHLWTIVDNHNKTKVVNTVEFIEHKDEYSIRPIKPIDGEKSMPYKRLLGAFYKPITFDSIDESNILMERLRNEIWGLPDEAIKKYFDIIKTSAGKTAIRTKSEVVRSLHSYYKEDRRAFIDSFIETWGNEHFGNLTSLIGGLSSLAIKYENNSHYLNDIKIDLKNKVTNIKLIEAEKTTSVPVKCIQVDSPSHTYCIGHSFIPTHNTTLCEVACVWAALYGFHNFILVVGCEADSAATMFNSIKSELVANELLSEDFPEVCYPIESLEGAANRASGQHVSGKRTYIKWNSDIAVLPTVEGSPASGCVIKYAGITGRIRGMKYKREVDGKNARPTLCIIDDPQTDESARSPKQIQDRLKVVVKTILNLPGAGQSISAICPCTVIEKEDMADKLLTRKEYPEWQGERLKALYKFPDNMELWNQYSDIRNKDLEEDGDGAIATKFYKKNRKEMDAGANVAWPERFTKKEISGLQYLMNKYFEDKAAFQSEFQQEPIVEDLNADQLTIGHILDKLNGYERGLIPAGCGRLTSYIDVQKNALFWAVSAWRDDFTGFLIDYGTFPKQTKRYFTLADLSPSLEELFPNMGLEARLNKALVMCCEALMGARYPREDGVEMQIQKGYIDANWGNSTDVVYNFCKKSAYSAIITPSHGKYFGAKDKPLIYKKRERGETIGHNWYYPNNTKNRAVRHIIIDTNYWKTFIYNRLMTTLEDSGSYSIFGSNKKEHELLAEHLTAEYWTPTAGNERILYEWSLRPNKKDNHWFDCIVGSAVAANELGCTRPEFFEDRRYKRPSTSFKSLAETVQKPVEAKREEETQQVEEKRPRSFASMANQRRGLR